MLEISSFKFAVTFSVTSFVMVSKISGEIVEGELDCCTESSGDCFPLLADVRFVKSVDFRFGAMMYTFKFLKKWSEGTESVFKGVTRAAS